MKAFRELLEKNYELFKPILFYLTKENAEIAHEWFVLFSRGLYLTRLEKLVLHHEDNYISHPFYISNAAGFNKDAKIPSSIIKALGFDRNVIGTVTGESWEGKKKPRIKRYPSYDSLINWVGWNNDGAEIISERIKSYRHCEIPITISIGATPNSSLSLEERFEDIEKTINLLKRIALVDRFEYCPSCPNINISREENKKTLRSFVEFIKGKINSYQKLDIKVSPDLDDREVDEILKATYDFVEGYVLTNTTIQHSYGKGAGSGQILYPISLEMQKKFYERLKDTDKRIIACGGIDSIDRIKERIEFEPQNDKEIQVFTPIIKEPKLLRKKRILNEIFLKHHKLYYLSEAP
jgi:dihydroorotate dehydrogenase